MTSSQLLAVEAFRQCRELLDAHARRASAPDEALECAVLLCRQVERWGPSWPSTRLHRALGYVQGVLVARGVCTFDEQQALVENLQIAFPEGADVDLEDHHDPKHPFHLELGESG